jgi:hypothetical protein
MFYLINCNTYECVNFQAIVGIADNKNGIMELLFNFHKQHFCSSENLTFECSHYDIQIFKITKKNYNYLLNKINNNIDKITENHEIMKYIPECQIAEYLFVILDNDGPQYDLFDECFHTKYNNIIKKSKQIII